MGGIFGGGGSKSQTTKTEPWSGQQPYLKDLMREAQNLYGAGVGQQYYPGQLVAGLSPETQQGIGALTQSGMQASPTQMAAQNYAMQSMMSPGMMAGVGMDMPGGNPYLDAMYNAAARQSQERFAESTLPGIAAMFGGAGRTGGGIQQEMVGRAAREFGRGLQDMGAEMYGGAYESGMGRDIQRRQLAGDIGGRAMQFAPQMQAMQQQQIQNLLRAGAITEDQAQRIIDAEKQKFDFQQQAPWTALGQYGNIVQGMPGGLGTTTAQQPQGSRLAGALGGAMAGSSFGLPGMILGGLGGLL